MHKENSVAVKKDLPVLTAKFAAQAALEAYEAGKLGFQNKRWAGDHNGCFYYYSDGGYCAIGAALAKLKIRPEDNGPVYSLVNVYFTCDLYEENLLTDLQLKHDELVIRLRHASITEGSDEHRKAVDEFLGLARKLAGKN